jgi:predicted nucleotide-binding protein
MSDRDAGPRPEDRSAFKVSKADAEAKLRERIDLARELEGTEPKSAPELDKYKHAIAQWRDYNRTWLDTNLGGEAADEYRAAATHSRHTRPRNPQQELSFLHEDVRDERAKLESILHRLDIWSSDLGPEIMNRSGATRSSETDTPVFVIHGSDTTSAQIVARAIERATGRDVIILREKPNSGRALIEKFEDHAEEASYAVALLTADDEGRRKGEATHQARARQNVIFEMGYFYGHLGRRRVSVLLDPTVERPSDMAGVVYITFSEDGAWKHELFRDMEAQGFTINWSRIP